MNRFKRLLCIAAAAVALSLCLVIGVSALSHGKAIATDTLHQRMSDDEAALSTDFEHVKLAARPTALSLSAAGDGADMLLPQPDQNSQTGGGPVTGTLDTDGAPLSLRSGPGTEYEILAYIPADAVLTLTGPENGWYQTSYNGAEGYVCADYIVLDPAGAAADEDDSADTPDEPVSEEPTPGEQSNAGLGIGVLDTNGTSLSLRSGPGTGYEILAYIPADAVLTLTGLENGWYQTSYNGTEGYVCADYIKLSDQNDITEENQDSQTAQNDPPEQNEQSVQTDNGLRIGLLSTGGSTLSLRSGPGTDYEKLASIPADAVLLLTGSESGWYKTSYNSKEGYVSGDYINANSQIDADLGAGTLDTNGETLSLRSGPGTGYDKLATIPSSATLTLTGFENGWFKTSYNGTAGYVCGDYIKLSKASDPEPAPTPAAPAPAAPTPTPAEPEPTPAAPAPVEPAPAETTPTEPEPAPSDSSLAAQVVAYAKQFLGKPYVYGTAGPNSFDCSGFTSYVFKHFGYSLNRSAADQYSNGTPVDQSQMQPGDLLLWRAYGSSSRATHVGIYIGNNQYIHASSTLRQVVINDMDYAVSTRYLVGVRRILN